MSYFICIAVPRQIETARYFDRRIRLEQANTMPVGKAVRALKADMEAFLVTMNGCSTDIMNRGGQRRRFAWLFEDGCARLCEQCRRISFLVHQFRGDVRSERVSVVRKQILPFSDFVQGFPDDIDEDVRYILLSGSDDDANRSEPGCS